MALRKLDSLNTGSVEEIVAKIPAPWMTDLAREFAIRLVNYNLQELQLLV